MSRVEALAAPSWQAQLAPLFGAEPTLAPLGTSGRTFSVTLGARVAGVAKRMARERRPADVARLLELVRRHGLAGPSLIGHLDLDDGAWLGVFTHVAGEAPRPGSPNWQATWDQAFAWLTRLALLVEPPGAYDLEAHWLARAAGPACDDDACLAMLQALRATRPGGPAVLAHGDFAPQNFVLAGAELALIDWEEIGRACPGFDGGWLLALNRVGAGPRLPQTVLWHRLVDAGLPAAALRWCEGLGLLRMHTRAHGWSPDERRTAVLARVRAAVRACLAENDGFSPAPGVAP